MSQAILLAFVPTWVSNWLTPVWIIGAGALLGLAVLVVLWIAMLAVSRIPGLGAIADDSSRRNGASVALSVVVFLLLVGGLVVPSYARWSGLAEDSVPENLILAVCLLVPVSVALAFGFVVYSSRSVLADLRDALREGPLGWILSVTLALAAFGVLGAFIAFQPKAILVSLTRFPAVGEQQIRCQIPATPRAILDDAGKSPPQHPIDVAFRTSELRSLVMRGDQNLALDATPGEDIAVKSLFEIAPGEETRWVRTGDTTPFEGTEVSKLYVRNYSTSDANLDLIVRTAPPHPEAWTIAAMAFATIGVVLAYLIQRGVMPKVSAVALSTFKSEVNQPLFMIVLIMGLVALAAFIFIPYNTFGEDIKVLKDSGMTLIMVLCIIQAVWAASTSVADEIEGRTALTVLSKPIGRRSFIIGKYLGIFWTVAVLFVLLGLWLLVCVAYKPIYDAREGADIDPSWQLCHLEMTGVVPGLILAFMETAVLAAISVAISTRLPMLANFIVCFSIYVLGHLTPLIVQSSVAMFEPVRFVAELVATLLPNLEHFNIQAAVAAGVAVPSDYLGWALLYCLIYGIIALLLALVLFEDRDLA